MNHKDSKSSRKIQRSADVCFAPLNYSAVNREVLLNIKKILVGRLLICHIAVRENFPCACEMQKMEADFFKYCAHSKLFEYIN